MESQEELQTVTKEDFARDFFFYRDCVALVSLHFFLLRWLVAARAYPCLVKQVAVGLSDKGLKPLWNKVYFNSRKNMSHVTF